MKDAFTLIEVVVAVVVFEVALLGVAGVLRLAASTLGRAETLESAVSAAEGVLDSLAGVEGVTPGAVETPRARIWWETDGAGGIVIRAMRRDSVPLLEMPARLPPS